MLNKNIETIMKKLLTLTLLTLCAPSILNAAAIQVEEKKAVAQAAALTINDHIAITRETVDCSRLRTPYWENPSDDEIYTGTECSLGADYITLLFTETPMLTLGVRHAKITQEQAKLCNDEWYDTGKNVLKLTKGSNNTVLKQLFSDCGKDNHELFYCILEKPDRTMAHTFAIEKMNIDGSTRWRIYQSWARTFGLREWLLTTPFIHSILAMYRTIHNDPYDYMHQHFGQGKLLTQKELLDFTQLLIGHRQFRENNCYIKMLPVRPHLKKWLQERLPTAHQQAANRLLARIDTASVRRLNKTIAMMQQEGIL
jgi:hypothetical protein